MKIFGLYASGYDIGIPRILVDPLKLRAFQRSIKSSIFLLPSETFWSENHVSKIGRVFRKTLFTLPGKVHYNGNSENLYYILLGIL